MTALGPGEAVLDVDGETRVVRMRPEGWTLFADMATMHPDAYAVMSDESIHEFCRWADVCGLIPDGHTAASVEMLMVACKQILSRGERPPIHA